MANLTIRDYLCQEAHRLESLPVQGAKTASEWLASRPKYWRQYTDALGVTEIMTAKARPTPHVEVVAERVYAQYRMLNLHYESLPDLHIAASLYIPHATTHQPAPAVLYLCGHAKEPRFHYQAHPRKLAELGFVVLVPDTTVFGEVKGVHHGLYREGLWHWISRGFNPGAIEMINAVRGIDYLQSLPEVDATRIGATGISGGGGTSWWLGAADSRVQAIAVVCGTGSNASHILDRTLDGHCDCLIFPNTLGWDFPDVYALVAPRPVLIAATTHDDVYTLASVRHVYNKLIPVYRALGAKEALCLVETPGPHAYHSTSRTAIFSFFLRHLFERDVAADKVGDIDETPEAQEPHHHFQVYIKQPPKKNRVASIHETFLAPPPPPLLEDAQALRVYRESVLQRLRESTFRAFPRHTPALDIRMETEWAFSTAERTRMRTVQRISFSSEPGWRLHLELHRYDPAGAKSSPLLLFLRRPEETRWEGEGFVNSFIQANYPFWLHAFLETRGIGETAWGRDLDWHVRRALPLLGQTIASMRVYDVLRALSALRTLPGVAADQITLAGTGEMAVIALYAALLDGKVPSVVLHNPPATQDSPGEPDGTGPALEMPNVLRITDAPQVAGLLFPAQLIFVGTVPQTYAWAEQLYDRLGAAECVSKVNRLSEWQCQKGEQ